MPEIELVDSAFTGEDAVRLAIETKPDLILMDLILPGINGVQAARQIKTLLPNTLIGVLTLYDLQEYRQEAVTAGAEELIHKSEFSAKWVRSLVEKVKARVNKIRILVVDDSPTIRRMVMTCLKPLGTEFGEASTGLEAIEQLARQEYHLMTLDLNMPDMHGVEVLEFLRGSQQYKKLPILVLTTRGDDNSRAIAINAGADDYLTKPFSPDDLLKAVKGLVKV